MECRWHGNNCPHTCNFKRWSDSGIPSGNGVICRWHGNNCPHTCSFNKWYNSGVPKREIKVGNFTYVIKQ
jgi:hypothetical protein